MSTTTALRLVARHEVPTHLQVEDKAFFGLAAPQFLCLLLGATLALGLWREWTFLPLVARLGLAGVCALAGVAGALIRPAGRDLVTWAFVVLHYVALPKTAVWRPRAPDVLPWRARSTPKAGWVDWTPRLAWAPVPPPPLVPPVARSVARKHRPVMVGLRP